MKLSKKNPYDYHRADNEDGHSETVIFRVLLSVLENSLTEGVQIVLEDDDDTPAVTISIAAGGRSARLVDHIDGVDIMLTRIDSDQHGELCLYGIVEYTIQNASE